MINRQITLAVRPVGTPEPAHFRLVSSELAALAPGELLVRNLFLSVDPAQRGYVNEENNYVPPVPVGAVMRALAVGQVVESHHEGYRPGEYLYGWFGWQEYCIAPPAAVLRRVDPDQATLSQAAGVLGINGLTAAIALRNIGQPKAGETVLVTAGAGGVGSIVGQLAKAAGCRTVAVVGSEDKGRQCLSEFGYDHYIDYRHDLEAELAVTCAEGIDVFFDNVAGPVADRIVRRMKWFGRIIQCGTISIPRWLPVPQGPRIEREILTRRLRLEGFVIFDHLAQFDAVAAELAALLKAGRLQVREDIEQGLETAPQALADVFAGRNRGKKLVALVR